MKKIILLLTIIGMSSCNSQYKRPLLGETEYQRELNASFKDATKSPLKKKDLENFKGLDFFPVDSTFIVLAKLIKIENAPTFKMATTTDRKPLYKKYGILKSSLYSNFFFLYIQLFSKSSKKEKKMKS